MAKRRQRLTLACDAGASLFKAIGGCDDELLPLVMPPEILKRQSEGLDRYRCQIGSDLLDRAFVGLGGNYFAVGSLAQELGAMPTFKPLKSETIVYKILAMVSIMAQRLNLGTSFELDLACLLPAGEIPDACHLKSSLASALADFDTPLGVFNVKLSRCDFHVEGMGIVQLQADKSLTGTGITLMAGHRNLTFLTLKGQQLLQLQTSSLGFNQWVKAVRDITYDYDLNGLSTAIATYWNGGDEKCLQPILRHTKPELRAEELASLRKAIETCHRDYCSLIFAWLDEHLPARIDYLTIAGGVGDVLQEELVEYFRPRMNPHPQYRGGGLPIFNMASFKLPVLDVLPEHQSRMADVYCLWKYLLPQPKVKSPNQ